MPPASEVMQEFANCCWPLVLLLTNLETAVRVLCLSPAGVNMLNPQPSTSEDMQTLQMLWSSRADANNPGRQWEPFALSSERVHADIRKMRRIRAIATRLLGYHVPAFPKRSC